MEPSGWISFWLVLIFAALLLLNGKVKRLARRIGPAGEGAGESTHPTPESMRQAIGKRAELGFSTGSQDTVRIIDVDDYCVLAECVHGSFGLYPAGTRWVLPLKDIVSVKILP